MQNEIADEVRLLSDVATLTMTCEACGHVAVLGFRELRDVQQHGVHTFGDVKRRGSCQACKADARPSREVSWAVLWHQRIRDLSAR